MDDGSAQLRAMHTALVGAQLIEPLDVADAAACARWSACDLASMVEGALDTPLDPSSLATADRARWLARLHTTYRAPDTERADPLFGRRFWLLDGGERVGTVQLPVEMLGRWLVPVHALYVMPGHRRRGVAGRLLDALYTAARSQEVHGIRIDTYWTWQRAIRFYLGRGFWVCSWKHAVGLVRTAALPARRVDVADATASLAIERDGRWEVPWRAERDGQRLVLHEESLGAALWASGEHDLAIYGLATFALALAMAGWPLVRSPEAWAERYRSSDVGQPEGLAHKIEVFEAIARQDGWVIRTPRIPGLAYRDLDRVE
jgi:GNAT superfamily N-acetyltransferase